MKTVGLSNVRALAIVLFGERSENYPWKCPQCKEVQTVTGIRKIHKLSGDIKAETNCYACGCNANEYKTDTLVVMDTYKEYDEKSLDNCTYIFDLYHGTWTTLKNTWRLRPVRDKQPTVSKLSDSGVDMVACADDLPEEVTWKKMM